jgi:hypothetical protein
MAPPFPSRSTNNLGFTGANAVDGKNEQANKKKVL